MAHTYDGTLARMAGNIAAGFASNRQPHLTEEARNDIAEISLDIADRIVTRAKAMHETEMALTRTKA